MAKKEVLGVVFAVRLRPDEARAVRAAIDGSGEKQADWLRRVLLAAAQSAPANKPG